MFQFNSKTYKILLGICSIVITAMTGYLIVQAGSLTPSSTPADTMKTLDDVYYELDKSASAVGSWGLDPSAAPTGTMYTLQQLYDKTPQFHTSPGSVAVGDVCNSKTFYTDSSTRLTGNRTDCSAAGTPPGVTKTGQTTSYVDYDDGYYEKGQTLSYTINTGDELGTVTDDNTGLMWKRCSEPDTQTSGCTGTHSTYSWVAAITRCESITHGSYSDWRLLLILTTQLFRLPFLTPIGLRLLIPIAPATLCSCTLTMAACTTTVRPLVSMFVVFAGNNIFWNLEFGICLLKI